MIKNATFLGYYFYTNSNIWGDFEICIAVPLNNYFMKLVTVSPYVVRINKCERIK